MSPTATAIAKRAIENRQSGQRSTDSRQEIESTVEEAARRIHEASGYRKTIAQAMAKFIKTPEGKALYDMLTRYDTPDH